MADRSSTVLTDLTDRRNAVRVLGTASTAVLAALGLGGATGEARDRGGPGKGKGKSDGNQRTRDARHTEGENRPADRGDELVEPVGDASAVEPVKNVSVAAQRKRRRSIRVAGDPSAPLAADGSFVFSRAFCPGGDGKLLGGGYTISGTPAQLVNAIVTEAAPDTDASSFTAVLHRTSSSGSTAGATIRAFAICKG
jgi:hypothetical protein